MNKKIKLEHIPLHCPLCKKRFMNLLGQPLPNHSQIRCTTTDGNEMDLGLCNNCVSNGISLEICTAILDGIKDYWIYEIDMNTKMKPDEKKKRKDYHNSHVINGIQQVIDTGKRAKKEARKQGKLK